MAKKPKPSHGLSAYRAEINVAIRTVKSWWGIPRVPKEVLCHILGFMGAVSYADFQRTKMWRVWLGPTRIADELGVRHVGWAFKELEDFGLVRVINPGTGRGRAAEREINRGLILRGISSWAITSWATGIEPPTEPPTEPSTQPPTELPEPPTAVDGHLLSLSEREFNIMQRTPKEGPPKKEKATARPARLGGETGAAADGEDEQTASLHPRQPESESETEGSDPRLTSRDEARHYGAAPAVIDDIPPPPATFRMPSPPSEEPLPPVPDGPQKDFHDLLEPVFQIVEPTFSSRDARIVLMWSWDRLAAKYGPDPVVEAACELVRTHDPLNYQAFKDHRAVLKELRALASHPPYAQSQREVSE